MSYIDLILLGAVAIAIIPTTFHTIRSALGRAPRREQQALTDAMSEKDAVLDPSVFQGKPKKA